MTVRKPTIMSDEEMERRIEEIHAELHPLLEESSRRRLIGMTDEQKHADRCHPDFEYKTTEGPRKAWLDSGVPPDGDGWEANHFVGSPPSNWHRFEFHEEAYWMRRKAKR